MRSLGRRLPWVDRLCEASMGRATRSGGKGGESRGVRRPVKPPMSTGAG
jgi:hypothetical protein